MSCHSIDVGIWILLRTGRWDANASHTMKINIIRAVNDRSDPMDDTTFHFMNASG